MGVLALTIAGDSKRYVVSSLNVNYTLNGRTTASFDVRSNDASYRPALGAEVVLTDGGSTILGGVIQRVGERSVFGDSMGDANAIYTRVVVADYHSYTERRFVNETLAAGTLKSMLTTLVANYLDDYGVTLHASQVNGPNIPEVVYEYRSLTEVLNELMQLTADAGDPYVWKIDESKVLRAFQPSTQAAPFNLTEAAKASVGDVTVDQSRDQYANKIILRVPPKTEMLREETFTGDGSEDTFTLQYTPFQTYGYVSVDGIAETMRYPDDPNAATWTFDPDTNTITRTSPPSNGAAIRLHFDGTYEGTATASDSGEITANGLWEKVLSVDQVPADTTAQALADAALAIFVQTPQVIKYITKTAGLKVGQTQSATLSQRNLSGVSAVVTELRVADYGTRNAIYQVTLTSGTKAQDRWRDVYKQWAGDKTGGVGLTANVSAGTASPISAGPGLPFTSVQFNESGVFGGDPEFTYDTTSAAVMVGLNHTPGGSVGILNGDGHVVN